MGTAKLAAELFQRSRDLSMLKSMFIDVGRELTGAPCVGFYLLDPLDPLRNRAIEIDVAAVPDSIVEFYETQGRRADPLLHHAMRHYSAVHQRQLFTDDQWWAVEPNREASRKFGMHHYLTTPLVRHGAVVGHLNFARSAQAPAFGGNDLAIASALSMLLSERLAVLELSRLSHLPATLTPREVQVASLAVDGLTNDAIASRLHISPNTVKFTLKNVFRKLQVPSRTALAARFAHIL